MTRYREARDMKHRLPVFQRAAGRQRQGFTLLEVMIAMAILAIALVAVFQSQSQSLSMAGDSRFLTTASLLAQARMAEIETASSAALAEASGDFGEDFPHYTWHLDVVAQEEIPMLKKMTLTVTNRQLIGRNSYHLVLYRVIP